MSNYTGGGSDDPLLQPLEGLSEDAAKVQGDLLSSYFNSVAGQTGTDVTQGIADALARLDNLRAALQDYATNEVEPAFGPLPTPTAAASVPAGPNDEGFELLMFDDAIRDDSRWESRGVHRTLSAAYAYIRGTALEIIGAILWDGEQFEVFAPDGTENI